jgi:hypothetical protein
MSEVVMYPMEGTNPLGLLAALGTFRSCAIEWPDVRLRWECNDIIPYPALVFEGGVTIDDVVAVLDEQRSRWRTSALLDNEYTDIPYADLTAWAKRIAADQSGLPVDEIFVALGSEGATFTKTTEGGQTLILNKPTQLCFTSGQQKFLVIVRRVLDVATNEALTEVLRGPWSRLKGVPTLRWDIRNERVTAVRGFDAKNEKRDPAFSTPAADWLGFLGLSFFPTHSKGRRIETTGCDATYKGAHFRWPLWARPFSLSEVKQMIASDVVAERGLHSRQPRNLAYLGIQMVLSSPIRRLGKGYGSFGAASVLCQAG